MVCTERTEPAAATHRLLIVDDEPSSRELVRHVLNRDGVLCDVAEDGARALQMIAAGRYDLVLLDIDMPRMQGTEVLRQLRLHPPVRHLKVMMLSGRASADELAMLMRAGADDYLCKPFGTVQLRERVNASLRLKAVQDRSDRLNDNLQNDMERNLAARDGDLVQARNALVLAMAELAAQRDYETGAHLLRLQHYCRCLAEEAAQLPCFAAQITPQFIDMLETSAPLHDIGKVGVPDHILLKPGRLSDDERLVMQKHTVIGAETLQKVAERHGFAATFMQMAIEIARHHHERVDGQGYPDRISGEAIPLAARILAVADVYDALRCKRVYKPAFDHEEAVRIMTEDMGHFDAMLLGAFQKCARRFDELFDELSD